MGFWKKEGAVRIDVNFSMALVYQITICDIFQLADCSLLPSIPAFLLNKTLYILEIVDNSPMSLSSRQCCDVVKKRSQGWNFRELWPLWGVCSVQVLCQMLLWAKGSKGQILEERYAATSPANVKITFLSPTPTPYQDSRDLHFLTTISCSICKQRVSISSLQINFLKKYLVSAYYARNTLFITPQSVLHPRFSLKLL